MAYVLLIFHQKYYNKDISSFYYCLGDPGESDFLVD